MGERQVGIWIRVSTQQQVDEESPQIHEFRARAYAQAQGWDVVAMYDLAGVSGKDIIAHPETLRMLEDVRTGRIQALVFSKLARLARNTTQLLYIAEIFREHNASLVSLTESLDTNTPAGRFFFTLLSAMASWEREEIAARVAESVTTRAQLGRPLGGFAPFGYQWTDGQLKLHPDEAQIRRMMYDLFLKYRRIRTVARILNEMGYRTRKGEPFAKSSVALLLRDPVAKGNRRTNYSSLPSRTKPRIFKPESEWVHVKVPALVDETTWDACQAILWESALKNKRKGRQPHHLFTGLLVCGRCWLKMYVQRVSTTYICRSCHRSTTNALMAPFVLEQIKNFLSSTERIEQEQQYARDALREGQEQIQLVEHRQLAIRAEQDALHQLFRGNYLSGQEFQERNTPLYAELQLVNNQREARRAEVDLLQDSLLRAGDMLQSLAAIIDHWPRMELLEQQASLESVVDRIVVGEAQTEVLLDLHHKTLNAGLLSGKKNCNRAAAAFI